MTIQGFKPAQFRKAIAATLAAIATWGVTAIADGVVNGVEWFGLVGVLAAAIATFGVENEDVPGPVV
jgi:hypothetical protein